jgi:hypothetical protein
MKILGVPVKISSQKSIYIPANFLQVYGIDRYLDCLIRQEFRNRFIFLRYEKRPLLENETVVSIRAGATYLPEQWIADNQLTPGKDSLYLVGANEGLLVSASEEIRL